MYQSNLSDQEWELIHHHFEPKDRRGSSHQHPRKLIVDAILYVVKGGIPWRLMPNDFPPWKTVYDHFRKWNQRGVWEAALDQLNQVHRKKKTARKAQATESLTHTVLKLNMLAKPEGSTATRK